MKKLIVLFITLIFLVSCTNEGTFLNSELDSATESQEIANHNESRQTPRPPRYVENELVVKFKIGVPESRKNLLRKKYGIKKYETCDCDDNTLELWNFGNLNIINEGFTTGEITNHPDLEDLDLQFLFPIDNTIDLNFTDELPNLVKSTNSGVTIAVIDSGISYNYEYFNTPFLYNSNRTCFENNETQSSSGWNYIDSNTNISDVSGHGTVVSFLIYKRLTMQNVDFQILPYKVFNENGMANYFDIACATKNAIDNPDVSIINMSFGWYYEEPSIMLEYLSNATDKLFITSAGNDHENIDEILHFPSAFDIENKIVVAGLNEFEDGISSISNFGKTEVDIAATSELIPFYEQNTITYLVTGTSFANSYVSARAASLHSEGMNPVNLKTQVINSGTIDNGLSNFIKEPYRTLKIYYE